MKKFHKHDLSGTDTASREALAQHVHSMYFDCHIAADGHRGCRDKLDAMESGKLGGVRLNRAEISRPFLQVIDALLGFCRDHYALEECRRYYTPTLEAVSVRQPLDSDEMWDPDDVLNDLEHEASSDGGDLETVDERTSPPQLTKGPLSDHSAIMDVLKKALKTRVGWFKDKIPNQFQDLPSNTLASTFTTSSRKRPSAAPSQNSVKRMRLTTIESSEESIGLGGDSLPDQGFSSTSSGVVNRT